ncbi:MAG: FKBP-type peptidyl-prolyl cis-trans isomerase [Prevotellaceae bacterium]|jgi:FKBP-type peptidyl-prolyl cis-trans isomerase SlyD|nr:FKBP-type peptidyl-prolyl cis-trans isomerase [Prevotellaceae bacterium]
MQISTNKIVTLSYQLVVDDDIVDSMSKESPLSFLFGSGMTIPKFEANIEGLRAGDAFKFTLSPEDGYGEVYEENIKEFPLEAFMIDGKLDDNISLEEGAAIPMQDSSGHVFAGAVVEVNENSVVLDFNHPLAGMELNFEGRIIGVREATEEELAQKSAGGCGCCNGNDCCDDNEDGCCCDSDSDTCGCGCH